MDAKKNGVIQKREFQYGMMHHDFVGGPEDAYSAIFGFTGGWGGGGGCVGKGVG